MNQYRITLATIIRNLSTPSDYRIIRVPITVTSDENIDELLATFSTAMHAALETTNIKPDDEPKQ